MNITGIFKIESISYQLRTLFSVRWFRLIFILVLMPSCSTTTLVYMANIEGGIAVMSRTGQTIAAYTANGILTIHKLINNQYVPIRILNANVWMPQTRAQNPVAHDDLKKYLLKISSDGQTVYYIDANTGFVLIGNINNTTVQNPNIEFSIPSGHDCTQPFKCYFDISGQYLSLYNHTTRNLTVFNNNRVLHFSTILNCDKQKCDYFNKSEEVSAGTFEFPRLQLVIRASNHTHIYVFLLAASISKVEQSTLRDQVSIFCGVSCFDMSFEESAPYRNTQDQVIGRNLIKAWGKAQRYANKFYFIEPLSYWSLFGASFFSDGQYMLEIRAQLGLKLRILQSNLITSLSFKQLQTRIAYTTADNKLIVIDFQLGHAQIIDGRQMLYNASNISTESIPSNIDTNITTVNHTDVPLPINKEGNSSIIVESPQTDQKVWSNGTLVAIFVVLGLIILVILGFVSFFVFIYCRKKCKHKEEMKNYIQQYVVSTQSKISRASSYWNVLQPSSSNEKQSTIGRISYKTSQQFTM